MTALSTGQEQKVALPNLTPLTSLAQVNENRGSLFVLKLQV